MKLKTAKQEPVADRAERLQFWTDIMRDPGEATTTRLRASELLSKALDGADSFTLDSLNDPALLSDAELAALVTS